MGLYQAGVIREHYFRADQHTAVLALESATMDEAATNLSNLPFVRESLISFELAPLKAYYGFARLFNQE